MSTQCVCVCVFCACVCGTVRISVLAAFTVCMNGSQGETRLYQMRKPFGKGGLRSYVAHVFYVVPCRIMLLILDSRTVFVYFRHGKG